MGATVQPYELSPEPGPGTWCPPAEAAPLRFGGFCLTTYRGVLTPHIKSTLGPQLGWAGLGWAAVYMRGGAGDTAGAPECGSGGIALHLLHVWTAQPCPIGQNPGPPTTKRREQTRQVDSCPHVQGAGGTMERNTRHMGVQEMETNRWSFV